MSPLCLPLQPDSLSEIVSFHVDCLKNVHGIESQWGVIFFFNAFSPVPLLPLPATSPSCPSPPSPLSYWEVFHEQLGPGRGEVSERGALCIIQWLSGVCVCVCLCVCVCEFVRVWPSPSIGRCQVTGRPCHWLSAGFLSEQSHCSLHYHKLMSTAQARLITHTLMCSSDVTHDTQAVLTQRHLILPFNKTVTSCVLFLYLLHCFLWLTHTVWLTRHWNLRYEVF